MTGASAATVTKVGANPFVGPLPIGIGQKIFGRDREIDELYYLLSAERIVLLHSPSGAGKSSLIQAGLMPRLAELFDVWGPTRVNLQPPEGESSEVNRYVRSANLGFEGNILREHQRPQEQLSLTTLSEYVAHRPPRPETPKNVVLIFDQFEEILTLDPLAIDAKHEFFDQLGKLLHNPHIWALFALREDYLAPLDPYAEQVPTHLKNRFRLDLLGRDAAPEAISKSVEEGGRDIARDAVEKLVNDLATMQVQQPDGTFESQIGPYVEPLHLQVACRGLWERMPEDRLTIDLDDIKSRGDVTKALAEYYEKEIAGIAGGDAPVERAIREWVGGKLITPDGIRGQVLKGAGKSEGLENELIGRLVDTHFVRGEQRAGATWFELSHDRLIEPVRKNNAAWLEANLSMLQREAVLWDKQNRPNGLLLRGQALVEAERWASEQADELTPVEIDFLAASQDARKQARHLRWMRIATIGGFALALIVLCWAGVEHWKMDQENIEAQAKVNLARGDADDVATIAEGDKEIAERYAGRLLASAQAKVDEANRKLGEADTKEKELSRSVHLATAVGLAVQSEKSRFIDKLPEESLLLAVEAIRAIKLGDLQTRTPENALREALAQSGGVVFGGDEEQVNDIAISSDRRWLATVTDGKRPGHLWDLNAKKLVPIALEGATSPVFITQDGRWVVSGSVDSNARLWDLKKQPIGNPVSVGSKVILPTITISPDGHWLIVNPTMNSTLLLDLKGDPATGDHKPLEGRYLEISLDDRWLVTQSDHNDCENSPMLLWDLKSGDRPASKKSLDNVQNVIASSISADGFLAAVSKCGTEKESIRIWNLNDPKDSSGTPLSGTEPTASLNKVAISPDHHLVAAESGAEEVTYVTYLWELPKISAPKPLPHPGNRIAQLAFSTNSAWLFGFPPSSYAEPKHVIGWDLSSPHPETADPILQDAHGERISSSVAYPHYGSDGSWVFLFSDRRAIVLDLRLSNPAGNPLVLSGHDAHISTGDAKVAGGAAVTSAVDGSIRVWNLNTSIPIANPIIPRGCSTALSSDQKMLAVGKEDGSVRLLDLISTDPDASPIRSWKGSPGCALQIAFSPDNKLLAITAGDGTLSVWQTSPLVKSAVCLIGDDRTDKKDRIASFQFSGDSRWLQTRTRSGISQLWDLVSQNPVDHPMSPGVISKISPNGRWIIASKDNKTFQLWDLTSISTIPRPLKGAAPAFSPNSRWLVVNGAAGVRQLLDLASQNPEEHSLSLSGVRRVEFSPDSRWLVIARAADARQLLDLASQNPEEHSVSLSGVKDVKFSPDGHWMVAASNKDDDSAQLLDLPSIEAPPHPLKGVKAVLDFSPNSRWLVTRTDDDMYLWDLKAKGPFSSVALCFQGIFNPVSFSSNGPWFVTFSSTSRWLVLFGNARAGFWDLEANDPPTSGVPVRDYHQGDTRFLGNNWLTTTFIDGEPRLWKFETKTAATPLVLPSHNFPVSQIDVGADGRWIIGTSRKGPPLLWDTHLEEDLIPLACRTAGRNFTADEWNQYFGQEPYHKTCPEFPLGKDVQLGHASKASRLKQETRSSSPLIRECSASR